MCKYFCPPTYKKLQEEQLNVCLLGKKTEYEPNAEAEPELEIAPTQSVKTGGKYDFLNEVYKVYCEDIGQLNH